MNAIPRRRVVRGRRGQRGFSLIELGIVIAVIAVLAAVVIFGRGFIAAGRITKAVEASNTIRKSASAYAGLQGGALSQPAVGTGLKALADRQLLPPLFPADGFWYVSGAAGTTDSISITAVHFGQQGVNNVVAIKVKTPSQAMAQDVYNSVKHDQNLNKAGLAVSGSATCSLGATVGDTVTICFNL